MNKRLTTVFANLWDIYWETVRLRRAIEAFAAWRMGQCDSSDPDALSDAERTLIVIAREESSMAELLDEKRSL